MGMDLLRAVVTSLLLTALAAAHDGLHGQLERLDTQLRDDPADAEVWLQRAAAWRRAGHLDRALDDVARAEFADPSAGTRHAPRARILAAKGCPAEALEHLDHALVARPGDPGLWRLRAELLTALDRPANAADAWDVALALSLAAGAGASPDHYLARLQAVLRTGDIERARAGLAQATGHLGLVPILQQRAMDLDLDAGQLDTALLRLDAMAAGAQRPEQWLARRGDLLTRAGRPDEARQAWSEALAAIERLGRRHRQTAAVTTLHAQLSRKLTGP